MGKGAKQAQEASYSLHVYEIGREVPGVVAVLCVVPSSGLVLHVGITSCTFPPWTEMCTRNDYENDYDYEMAKCLRFGGAKYLSCLVLS